MEKLKLHSPDFIETNIAKLAELFPNCVTENCEADGSLKKVIDFEQLRQELSTSIVEGSQERYQLNWPGKREALLTANAPIAKTLRPCREESVDFDSTQNLFIEGDNLDALKLLQETYLGKVKMIYIDPPYNTGNDFIYNDNFTAEKDKYDLSSGQRDEEGNRLVDEQQFIKNQVSNGRFHSDWLSMMYPRLKLARNLMRNDGVIFISIDDGEFSNLRKMCDEIFSEENFVSNMVWQSKKGGGSDNNLLVKDHEYVICYCKQSKEVRLGKIELQADPLDRVDEKGRYRLGRELNKWGSNSRREDRPTMFFPIPGPNNEEVYPIRNDGSEGCWRWGKKNMMEIVNIGDVEFVQRNDGTYIVYEKIRTEDERVKPYRTWLNDAGTTADGSKVVKSLFDDVKVFDFPKPIDLLETLIDIGAPEGGIILDFFSGSCSTIHAAMNLLPNRKTNVISIQLPELTDEKSEAFKAGYLTIADIGKERIRRVGKKIKAENVDKEGIEQLDIGFRVLKIDSSNMKDVYYTPDQLKQGDLEQFTDNIKDDRSAEDLLFQVLLDWGVDLTLPITKETICGKTVLFVDGNALAACFDTDINETFVKELAAHHPLRVVFRDAGFVSDSVKINIEQIFKLISPVTEIKVI